MLRCNPIRVQVAGLATVAWLPWGSDLPGFLKENKLEPMYVWHPAPGPAETKYTKWLESVSSASEGPGLGPEVQGPTGSGPRGPGGSVTTGAVCAGARAPLNSQAAKAGRGLLPRWF